MSIYKYKYELKYLKYKNKYFNLRIKYLSEHSNNQNGGANRIIIFGCTSINDGSTLDKNFDLINNAINKLISVSDIKYPYFLIKSFNKIENKPELVAKLIQNNYIVSEDNIKNTEIMQFINEEFIAKNKTIDVLILAECNYLLATITSTEFTIKYLTRKGEYKNMFDIAKPNLYNMYKAVDGYIINIYHYKSGFINVEDFISQLAINYILLHNIFYKIFNRLFTRIEDGVYRKNPGITEEDYNIISNKEYDINLELFLNIMNSTESKEYKIEMIIKNFLPESYIRYLKMRNINDSFIKSSIISIINNYDIK